MRTYSPVWSLFVPTVKSFGVKVLLLEEKCIQKQITLHDTCPGDHVRRHRRLRPDPCCSLFSMTIDSEIERESRIRGDPEALERWICSTGGSIGPVVLEGELGLDLILRVRHVRFVRFVLQQPRYYCIAPLYSSV